MVSSKRTANHKLTTSQVSKYILGVYTVILCVQMTGHPAGFPSGALDFSQLPPLVHHNNNYEQHTDVATSEFCEVCHQISGI